MRRPWSQLNVAITGASSGIGAASALALAERGAAVGLCARNAQKLEAVAKNCQRRGARMVVWRRADVGVWRDVALFAEACRKEMGDAHVVVANAGFGSLGNTLDLDPAEVESLFRTNVTGALWTIQAFGPQLERARGHAIVVGSVVSKIPIPYSSVYSASKWALRGWTRAARPELESRGIALTLFDPGYVRTEFFQHRVHAPGLDAWRPRRGGMTAEKVARRLLRTIRNRRAEVEMTWLSRVGIPAYRLMPIWTPRIMARFVRKHADARFVKRSR